MKRFYLLFLVPLFCCCSSNEQSFQLPPNAKELLTSNSTKVWKLARRFNNKTRMNMGDCFLSYRASYSSNGSMNDNAGENRDCGETLMASWKFVKGSKGNDFIKITSDQLPSLMNIEDNFKHFKVMYLDEEELILQYSHKQFSNKSTKITDIYVPEHVEVKDRTFHW